jgi:hypothetical protein
MNDHSWMYRDSLQGLRRMDYCNGVSSFINFTTISRNFSEGGIRCPCKRCKNKKFLHQVMLSVFIDGPILSVYTDKINKRLFRILKKSKSMTWKFLRAILPTELPRDSNRDLHTVTWPFHWQNRRGNHQWKNFIGDSIGKS